MVGTQRDDGIGGAHTQDKLDRLLSQVRTAGEHQVGYPTNLRFDYSPLYPFLDYSLNNVGDPFHESNYWINTHEIERDVIFHFARLMRIDPNEAWGYVTSGGTEGNMYGLYLARELYPNAMFYFSEDTHYSVLKNVRVLNARYIMIKRQENGEIDYRDLHDMINVHRDVPAVIMANIGTTMRGAVDDLGRIKRVLQDSAVTSSYIHADAALSGMILPFVAEPQLFGFDAGIDSISVSGHKLLGAPLPCGVVLTRRGLRGAREPRGGVCGGARHHAVGLPQRFRAAHALVCPYALWRRRHSPSGGRHARHRRICGAAVQRARDRGLAPPQLCDRGLSQTSP